MAILREDIKSQSDWIVKAFSADGFKLDYTIDSIVEVDRFFTVNMKNGQPKKGGRLYGKGFGPILFSIGSYVGETIIKNGNFGRTTRHSRKPNRQQTFDSMAGDVVI